MAKAKLLFVFVGLCFLLGLSLLTGLGHAFLATNGPDPQDRRAIERVLTQFYALLDAPEENVDADRFAEILVDAPEYPLTKRQQQFLTETLAFTSVQKLGYLTYMQAEQRHEQQGQQLLRAALKKAKAEQRAVTAEEWAMLKQQNHGELPSALRDPNAAKTEVKLDSIKVAGNKAVVRYRTQPADEEAVLVKFNGKWFIAGVRVIWAHF